MKFTNQQAIKGYSWLTRACRISMWSKVRSHSTTCRNGSETHKPWEATCWARQRPWEMADFWENPENPSNCGISNKGNLIDYGKIMGKAEKMDVEHQLNATDWRAP